MDPSWRNEARRLWVALATATPAGQRLARFLADWPAANERPLPPEPAAAPLPVLRWLPRIAADAGGFGAGFVETVCAEAGSLAWRQTYAAGEVGVPFLQNYGWAELFGAARAPVGDAPQISCGVLVLGPDTFYPPHRHEAEEIYVPLVGTAEWQQGDAAWRRRFPGTLIHHSSEEPHAMRTGDQPLLAMYLWRSNDPGQRARLDRRRAG